MVESIEFRRVMGHFPSGVTVVTTSRADGSPCGLTVNAFCSVSLTPPLVLICVETTADSHQCILDGGAFAVNVLSADGESLSRRFAEPLLGTKFEGVAYRKGATGSPILSEALAWVDCRVHRAVPGGDHTIFIGEVLEADTAEGRPLLYYRGGYGRFEP
jgi:flavin reductase (DIM6/NTAB) family NADH-FMN oxidoreductase RutF